jgi:hypothetical protein
MHVKKGNREGGGGRVHFLNSCLKHKESSRRKKAGKKRTKNKKN